MLPGIDAPAGRVHAKLKRKIELLPAALSAPSTITGVRFASFKEWEQWWQKSKASSRVRP